MMRKGLERKRKLAREDVRDVWEQTACSEDFSLRMIRGHPFGSAAAPFSGSCQSCVFISR